MIQESRGKISEDLFALGGIPWLPAYLFIGKHPVLFDSGMTFMGPRYLEELKSILGNAHRLEHIFLTHSHYDHAGGAPFLKRNIPGLKIGASRLAAEIFKRPNAIQLIQSLSRDEEKKNATLVGCDDVSFPGLDVDVYLEDGAEMDLGNGNRLQVFSSPGHTRDALSFYLPEKKVLIPGEAVGVPDKNHEVIVNFLYSYNDYLASMEKLAGLEIEMILMAHYFFVTGEDARTFIPRSIARTKAFRERILLFLDEAGGDQEAVVQRLFAEDYEQTQAGMQEPRPYLINLTAKVKAVAEGK